jgi:hypothetical protein
MILVPLFRFEGPVRAGGYHCRKSVALLALFLLAEQTWEIKTWKIREGAS